MMHLASLCLAHQSAAGRVVFEESAVAARALLAGNQGYYAGYRLGAQEASGALAYYQPGEWVALQRMYGMDFDRGARDAVVFMGGFDIDGSRRLLLVTAEQTGYPVQDADRVVPIHVLIYEMDRPYILGSEVRDPDRVQLGIRLTAADTLRLYEARVDPEHRRTLRIPFEFNAFRGEFSVEIGPNGNVAFATPPGVTTTKGTYTLWRPD